MEGGETWRGQGIREGKTRGECKAGKQNSAGFGLYQNGEDKKRTHTDELILMQHIFFKVTGKIIIYGSE